MPALFAVAKDDDFVAPIDRKISPKDATQITNKMESIYYIGTSGLKITNLNGLEHLAF